MIYFGKLAILNSSRVIRENLSQDVASKHDIEMIKVTTSVMHILRFHPRCRIGQKIKRRKFPKILIGKPYKSSINTYPVENEGQKFHHFI